MGRDVLHLYVVRPRNLFIFGLNRAKRGQLERCGAYRGRRRVGVRWTTTQYSPSEQRTTSKTGMKTIRRVLTYPGNRVPYRYTTIGLRSLMPRYSIGHLWRIYRVFTPRAFDARAAQESPRTSTSEILRFYIVIAC